MGNKPKWYSILLLGIVLLLATLVLGCQAPPLIVEFSATPSEISSGESAILFWSVTEATSISIDQGIDDVSAVGTQTVSPMTTTAYTLTASNAAGTVTKSVVITVTTAPPVPSSFDTYINDMWGYSISYPSDWDVNSTEPESTDIYAPYGYYGVVGIEAEERSSLSIRDRVQILFDVNEEIWDSVTVLDSKEMEGMWDWYVSCDYYLEEYDVELHEEIYYKDTAQYSYRVSTFSEKAAYDVYSFSEIAETFTLLQEEAKDKEVLSASFVITDWEQDYYEYSDEWSDYVYVYYEVENTGVMDIDYYEVYFVANCWGGSYHDWTNGMNVRVGDKLSDSTMINVAGKEVMNVEVEDWELTAYGYG
jgi:hypothetical protein